MDLTAPTNAAIDLPVPSLFEDCTVTSVNPLRIRRDGDSTDLPFAPDTMIPESLLAVSDRVRVENANGRLIIVGRGTGIPVATAATPDTLILRDASGRAKVADPSEPDDIDTMGARDAAIAAAVAGVIPSSVAVGSGSASVAANGIVTFTGASSVSLNGVFDSTTRYYRIVGACTGGSAAVIQVRLRASGADQSGNDYDRTEITGRNGATSSLTLAGQSLWTVLGFINTWPMFDMELVAPGMAERTRGFAWAGVHGSNAASNTSNGIIANYITHRQASAYDGLTIIFSNAQDGTVFVEALR